MKEIDQNELAEMLLENYQLKIPLYVAGPPGIGKSDIVKQTAQKIAERKEREYIEWNNLSISKKEEILSAPEKYFVLTDIRLAEYDPTDLKGLFDFLSEEANERDYLISKPPMWFIYTTKPGADGIIFFDELPNAAPSVQKSAYQIFYDKQNGEFAMEDDVYIVAAGNRLEDNAEVFDIPDPLKDRMDEVELKASLSVWKEWALKEGIDSRILAFLEYKPSYFLKNNRDNKAKQVTPRGWHKRVNEKLEFAFEKGISPDKMVNSIAASIGEGAAIEFTSFIKLNQKYDIEEIMKNPNEIWEYVDDRRDITLSILGEIPHVFRRDKDRWASNVMDIVHALTFGPDNKKEKQHPDYAVFLLHNIGKIDRDYFERMLNDHNDLWSELANKLAQFIIPKTDQ